MARTPYVRSGQVVGLLGGSFDPAHSGHVHITLEALKRFGLDQIWWLVSPANPLKHRNPEPLTRRLEHARAVMQHPAVKVTDFEAQAGTRYTAETLTALQKARPGVNFVWLMGADNLAQFHHWDRWRWIMQTVPVGVLARPGDRISARNSVAAKVFARSRLKAASSRLLGRSTPPRWCFINVPMRDESSTAIRAAGGWGEER